MRTLRRATNRREQGASAVEFALILTPLLLIVFGLVQYGMYFWAKQGASAAARDAAREAAVGKPADCATFRDNVRDSIGTFATDEIANPPVIKRTYSKGTGNSLPEVEIGDEVTVQVQFKSFDLNLPFLPFIDGGLISEHAESRVDYVPAQPETCA